MPEVTRALLEKKDSKEISIRALKLGIAKKDLLSLLAVMPEAELEKLVEKYLASKKHSAGE